MSEPRQLSPVELDIDAGEPAEGDFTPRMVTSPKGSSAPAFVTDLPSEPSLPREDSPPPSSSEDSPITPQSSEPQSPSSPSAESPETNASAEKVRTPSTQTRTGNPGTPMPPLPPSVSVATPLRTS